MSWKKITTGSSSAVTTLLILGILLAVNAISMRRFRRWDLTQRRQYTISDTSIASLKTLDDPVFIRCFFSGQLPAYLRTIKQEVLDMLMEYQTYAGDKVVVEVIDPTDEIQFQLRASGLGIPLAQFNIIEENKVQLLNAYFGMAVEYEDRNSVIPLITTTTTLEYDLTSAIKKVTNPEVKTIAFLTGHHERSIYKEYKAITAEMLKHYKLMEADTRAGEAIYEEVDTLVIARPKGITERDKYEIDQFLMRGGKLIFLIDTIEFTGPSLDTRLIKNSLYDILEHYGVEIPYEVVLDPEYNAQTAFQTDLTQFKINYPFWPMVINRNMDRTNPVTIRLESLVLPWTSQVIFIPEHQPDITYTSLANNGPHAWTEGWTGNNLRPRDSYPQPPDVLTNPFSLVGVLSGRFKSYYANKSVPLPDEDFEKANPSQKPAAEKILQSPDTQITVIGNSRFLMNHYLNLFPSNSHFFLNLLDWLNSGGDLIQIRSRHSFDRPLEKTSAAKKTMLKYINTFSASVLVMLFGLARWLVKRRAKRQFEAHLKPS